MAGLGIDANGARTQSLFREVNERVVEMSGFDVSSAEMRLLCECADEGCVEPIGVAAGEYESVRRDGNRFFVIRGHVYPEIERVVADVDGYQVVEKFGEAGRTAERLDPRRHGRRRAPAQPASS